MFDLDKSAVIVLAVLIAAFNQLFEALSASIGGY